MSVIFLDTVAPMVTNVVALTPATVRITYSENINEIQAKTAANYKLVLTSVVSGSGSVFVLTLGSSKTSNVPYTILVNKSGVQDLSTSPNNLGCANDGDFLGQEQIKIVSASCTNSNSVILNFSKAPKSGNNISGSTECASRYKIVGASDLGTINSAKMLDGIVCNGATADSAKVCVVHNLVQTGTQYTIIAADSVDGDGFDNASWGSIRNSLDTENLQSSPRDRASFLGCGTSPVNFADGPISIDPNSSTFGYLMDFNSKIYPGPNNSGTGFCTPGSNCDAFDGTKGKRIRIDFLPYFGGPSTGLLGINNNAHPNWGYYIGVDSMFVFKNRIYAANGGLHAVGHNGSIIRSTTADPTVACTGPDSCSNWVEIGPRTNTKWHNSPTNNWFSLELNQFYNLIPGDKAFAQFAEFNNNLYVTRTVCVQSSQAIGIRTSAGTVAGCTDGTTTNRRAQLWKCVLQFPETQANATRPIGP
ncbi:hypothetical protein LEP1GSC062_3091 [Leptospira alexanderi serovar Manhao 3 str. L 60]|uniref:Uncharacterized protein n=1 Tax=Leptospira alexanderi serovar Manhao 3 str. L 60 TaxID=1049759 RepID=V6I6L0_9LEPT|nr:hypothetical protein LEP1GSC062_3091 [Leptospira alexanderi serovar Manhao 3 str. L 60]